MDLCSCEMKFVQQKCRFCVTRSVISAPKAELLGAMEDEQFLQF